MQFIKIIPTNPSLILDQAREEAVVQLLQDLLPEAGDIDCNSFARLHFADPEDALESLSCRACQSRLMIGPEGDDRDWWSACLEHSYIDVAELLALPTPCCGSLVRIEQLAFEPDAGFSHYEVCVNDPSGQLTEGDHRTIGDAFGCDVVLVHGHYAE